MPQIVLPISLHGPIIEAIVGVSQHRAAALRKAGQLIPEPVEAQALVDTGASITCIDDGVVEALSLKPLGPCALFTGSTRDDGHQSYTYDISLRISHPDKSFVVPIMPVAGIQSPTRGRAFSVVIGRNVLNHCAFLYNGVARQILLAW